jgi:hypothetical protein
MTLTRLRESTSRSISTRYLVSDDWEEIPVVPEGEFDWPSRSFGRYREAMGAVPVHAGRVAGSEFALGHLGGFLGAHARAAAEIAATYVASIREGLQAAYSGAAHAAVLGTGAGFDLLVRNLVALGTIGAPFRYGDAGMLGMLGDPPTHHWSETMRPPSDELPSCVVAWARTQPDLQGALEECPEADWFAHMVALHAPGRARRMKVLVSATRAIREAGLRLIEPRSDEATAIIPALALVEDYGAGRVTGLRLAPMRSAMEDTAAASYRAGREGESILVGAASSAVAAAQELAVLEEVPLEKVLVCVLPESGSEVGLGARRRFASEVEDAAWGVMHAQEILARSRKERESPTMSAGLLDEVVFRARGETCRRLLAMLRADLMPVIVAGR